MIRAILLEDSPCIVYIEHHLAVQHQHVGLGQQAGGALGRCAVRTAESEPGPCSLYMLHGLSSDRMALITWIGLRVAVSPASAPAEPVAPCRRPRPHRVTGCGSGRVCVPWGVCVCACVCVVGVGGV